MAQMPTFEAHPPSSARHAATPDWPFAALTVAPDTGSADDLDDEADEEEDEEDEEQEDEEQEDTPDEEEEDDEEELDEDNEVAREGRRCAESECRHPHRRQVLFRPAVNRCFAHNTVPPAVWSPQPCRPSAP